MDSTDPATNNPPAEDQEEKKTEQKRERPKRQPRPIESEVLLISGKRDPKSYKLISKRILKKFNKLELRALNNATGNVVILAETLTRMKLTKIVKIFSEEVSVSDQNRENSPKSNGTSFVCRLVPGERFEELTQNID